MGAAAWRLTCSLATQAEAHGEAGLDPITQDSLDRPGAHAFRLRGRGSAVLPALTQPLPVATDARGLTRTGRARRSPRRTTGRQSCLPCSTRRPGGTFVRDDPGSDAIRVCVGQPGGGDLVPP